MQVTIHSKTIELHQGDITLEKVDAIANAANSRLAGGGGVDGAIHRRGGPTILQETDAKHPDGCPTGLAVITSAGNLDAKYVLHAVGPVWHGGTRGESDLLASAYRSCLALAAENDCHSVAFPAISAGTYRYPLDQAARIALTTVIDFFADHEMPKLVRFILFTDATYGAFAAALEELTGP